MQGARGEKRWLDSGGSSRTRRWRGYCRRRARRPKWCRASWVWAWTAAARLDAVITTAAMDEAGLNAWCRSNGVYLQELASWRTAATEALAEPEEARASPMATRQDRRRIKRQPSAPPCRRGQRSTHRASPCVHRSEGAQPHTMVRQDTELGTHRRGDTQLRARQRHQQRIGSLECSTRCRVTDATSVSTCTAGPMGWCAAHASLAATWIAPAPTGRTIHVSATGCPVARASASA
jgi:hypothetical protein